MPCAFNKREFPPEKVRVEACFCFHRLDVDCGSFRLKNKKMAAEYSRARGLLAFLMPRVANLRRGHRRWNGVQERKNDGRRRRKAERQQCRDYCSTPF